MFQEQKLPDIGGTLIGMSPQSKYWGGGHVPPCPIGIDATDDEQSEQVDLESVV